MESLSKTIETKENPPMISLNFMKSFLQYDLFKQPLLIRTERSIEGNKWDLHSGSILGLFLSTLIFVGMGFYALEITKQMNQGLLDNFSSQQIVNMFDNEKSNSISLYDFNFLPSVSIGTIGRNQDLFDEFMSH